MVSDGSRSATVRPGTDSIVSRTLSTSYGRLFICMNFLKYVWISREILCVW